MKQVTKKNLQFRLDVKLLVFLNWSEIKLDSENIYQILVNTKKLDLFHFSLFLIPNKKCFK